MGASSRARESQYEMSEEGNRFQWTVLGALGLLLAACSSGAEATPEDSTSGGTLSIEVGDGSGELVGLLEVPAPSTKSFVLRGTLPVPKGFYTRDQGPSPLVVRGPGGVLTPAQVEIVSRYPNPGDGADVIELLARVRRPAGTRAGDRLVYQVRRSENEMGPHRLTDPVRDLIGTPGALTLRSNDVFGHRYEADLLHDMRENDLEDLRLLRNGAIARQMRNYEDLLPIAPVAGEMGTLPHLMGVHAYVTTWADEDFFSVDLRVHNGHDGNDPSTDRDDPLGKLYFESLELQIPEGWRVLQAYPTPSMGARYRENGKLVWELVKRQPDGALHLMPQQSQFHRRLVVCRKGTEFAARSALAEEGLGFCQPGEGGDLFSWWNPETSRYWAQNMPLPDLSYMKSPAVVRAELSQDYRQIYAALTHGRPGPWPILTGNLGWAHPWGLKVGNMHGGSEIYYSDGVETAWSASLEGYRTFQMSHRMYTERHPTALYSKNGDAFQLEDWIVEGAEGPFLPTWMFLVPWLSLGDPFGFTSAPTFQVEAVQDEGRQPAYERRLEDFQWIDTQHLVRYTRSAKVLAWLGNDALAKDDLHLQAELCRATYTMLPQTETGHTITTGLLHDQRYVEKHPNDGFVIDRGEGWILDTVASAYALAQPRWRRNAHAWFGDIVDVISAGQSDCSGTIMSKPNLNHFRGQYRILQSISECILQNGLWGVWTTAYEGTSGAGATKVKSVLEKSTYAMISDEVWDLESNSPHFYTALGPYDQNEPSFCGWVPDGGHEGEDGYQTWNLYVFGYLLTKDPRFVWRASQMAGGTLTPEHIGMDNHPGELETRAGMIGFLQNRGSLDHDHSSKGDHDGEGDDSQAPAGH